MYTYLKRLKELRKESGLSQQQVAEILHVTQSTYSKYESGMSLIKVDQVIKLAEFYDVCMDYIGGFTDKKVNFINEN